MNAAPFPRRFAPIHHHSAGGGAGGRFLPRFRGRGSSVAWNPRTALHSRRGHGAPQLRSKWRFSQFGEAAFFPFSLPPFLTRQASCSLHKRKHPKLFADANSRLPAELCLMSLRGLRFLLGTFRWSSAVFFLPRRDPNEVACSCVIAIPFAATFSSCAVALFLVANGTARVSGSFLSEANILNYCKLSSCSCTQPCSLPALVPSWHGMTPPSARDVLPLPGCDVPECHQLGQGEAEQGDCGVSPVPHQYLILRDALVTPGDVESQVCCANAVQMQVLLKCAPCRQVRIYSGAMSHLLRYHGYRVPSAGSIQHDQPLTILRICACTTRGLFFSLGNCFLFVLEPSGRAMPPWPRIFHATETKRHLLQTFRPDFRNISLLLCSDIQHHYFILIIV